MSTCCGRIFAAGWSTPAFAGALTLRHTVAAAAAAAAAAGPLVGGSRTPSPQQRRRTICVAGGTAAPAVSSPGAFVVVELLRRTAGGLSPTATAGRGHTERAPFSAKAGGEAEPEKSKDAAREGRPGAMLGAFDKVDVELFSDSPDDEEEEEIGGEGAEVGDDGIDRSKYTNEVKFRMPDLGDAGEEDGVVVKWYKKEGDIIRRKDLLCDVKTELFTFGMESDDEKTTIMGEILVPEGNDPVEPGEVLCVILHEETEMEKENS